jgi:hypothetical protein
MECYPTFRSLPMRFPSEYYQMERVLTAEFGHLRPAQRRGLTLWVYGAIRAHSACQNAVMTGLIPILGHPHAIRERLREWLKDGKDKAAPCATELAVRRCFVPLLRWILRHWHGTDLALAVDITYQSATFTVIAISVLYRGCAIPVAWSITEGYCRGRWMPTICALLDELAAVIPQEMHVLVLADRGLRSGDLWRTIHAHGWHPGLRMQLTDTFRVDGRRNRQPVRELVSKGAGLVGTGKAFERRHVKGTLIVLWEAAEPEPWAILTDGAPGEVGAWWYRLRMWIELGFRALKGVGWQWDRTRRTDPARAARHWLVLAVASAWVMATGTRVEDALERHMLPAQLHVPPRTHQRARRRQYSVFALGLSALTRQLDRGVLWRCIWFRPEPWPTGPPDFPITYHPAILQS